MSISGFNTEHLYHEVISLDSELLLGENFSIECNLPFSDIKELLDYLCVKSNNFTIDIYSSTNTITYAKNNKMVCCWIIDGKAYCSECIKA